jgi:hypothetical protein
MEKLEVMSNQNHNIHNVYLTFENLWDFSPQNLHWYQEEYESKNHDLSDGET